MKNKLTALALVAVTAFSLVPKPAQAGDKERALVGGLIGGLIIGAAINESRHSAEPRTTVIVHDRDDRCDDRAGYWKNVEVRVWVPGYWIVERRHGCEYRRYVSGHYECRTDRVWVAYDCHDRRSDRRDYGRGR
jgi:hypothetical protein